MEAKGRSGSGRRDGVPIMESRDVDKTWIRELYENYERAMEPWQIRMALARLKKSRLSHDAWEDAMQELAVLLTSFRFDPQKARAASRETVVCRLIDKRISSIARRHARRIKWHKRLAELAKPMVDERTPDDEAMDAELRALLTQLSPEQQKICQGLMDGKTIAQVARGCRRDWDTIERQIDPIRRFLKAKGYDE